jgi:hypothetical protein
LPFNWSGTTKSQKQLSIRRSGFLHNINFSSSGASASALSKVLEEFFLELMADGAFKQTSPEEFDKENYRNYRN